MIRETYYTVVIKKHTAGEKEQKVFEKIYDSDHPKLKANPDLNQYEYKDVIKSFTDSVTILEQRCESIDIERVLKSINKGL